MDFEKIYSDLNDKGIYGIFVDNKLLYIGMTMKSFKSRFNSHRRHINEVMDESYKKDSLYDMYVILAKYVSDGKNVELRPLVCLSKLNLQPKSVRCKPRLTRRDVECMELAFISYFKPVFNNQGIKTGYPLDRI